MIKSIIGYINNIFKTKEVILFNKYHREYMRASKRTIEYYCFKKVDDIPQNIESKIVYIIGEKGFEWLAVFNCPCGCGDIIQLNLLKEATPSWRFMCHRNGRISVSPSINRIVNCQSHFNIVKGKIKWWGEYTY